MNIWNLTKKDLAIFFRDRGSLIWLFLLPLVFILIFAGLAGMTSDTSGEGQAEDTRPPLVLVNLDQGGESAEQLVQRLSAPDAFRLIQLDEAEAQNRVSKYAINRYLLIPASFSADLSERKQVALTLITHPNSNTDFDQTVLRMVNGVARDLSLELQILDGIQVMGQIHAKSHCLTLNRWFQPSKKARQAGWILANPSCLG
jgi:ABC-type Na+ efflux pump permease subunit